MQSTSAVYDNRYLQLFIDSIDVCRQYRPKFGRGRKSELTMDEFISIYGSDPFYHWIGIDTPLMYTAHKVSGGMTSVYRQIGIGCQRIFLQMLQDFLGLAPEQTTWTYTTSSADNKLRYLSLDGRITIEDIEHEEKRAKVQQWITDAASSIDIPDDTIPHLKGVVFEVRQGYKSKDSKRQNADIINASRAYAHQYLPAIVLFSTQIDTDVLQRYRESLWVVLTGTTTGSSVTSTYAFCRGVIGYDLANFFDRHSQTIREKVEYVLETLLKP